MAENRRRPIAENDVTEAATKVIFRDVFGSQPAVAPSFEIADEEGLKPDRIIVVLDDDLNINEMKVVEADDLVIHTIESKVDRRYLVGPEFSGVAQASDYWGNYNWLAVSEDADLDDEDWEELHGACKQERIGLLVCGWTKGHIVFEPGCDDTEHFTHYPHWGELLDEFRRHVGFDVDE